MLKIYISNVAANLSEQTAQLTLNVDGFSLMSDLDWVADCVLDKLKEVNDGLQEVPGAAQEDSQAGDAEAELDERDVPSSADDDPADASAASSDEPGGGDADVSKSPAPRRGSGRRRNNAAASSASGDGAAKAPKRGPSSSRKRRSNGDEPASDDDARAPEGNAGSVSIEELMQAAGQAASRTSKEDVMAVLEEFGVGGLQELDRTLYAEVAMRLEELGR